MTNVKRFEFKKAYETIEAGDHTFIIDMSDEAIKKYSEKFTDFDKKVKKINVNKLSHDEQHQELMKIVRDSIDSIIGTGKFDMLYQETGKSIFTMMDFALYLAEVTTNAIQSNKNNEAINKYVK